VPKRVLDGSCPCGNQVGRRTFNPPGKEAQEPGAARKARAAREDDRGSQKRRCPHECSIVGTVLLG